MWIRTLLSVLAVVLLLILVFTKSPLSIPFGTEDGEVTAVSTSDDAARERVLDERFTVREGGTLSVAVGDADLSVRSGPADEVHVEIFLEGTDMQRARAYFERQHFSVRAEGATVRVEADPERGEWHRSGNWRDRPHLEVVIHAPERFNADLRTSDGDVRLDRLEGTLRLHTSDGDVSVGTLAGESADVSTSDGDIRLEALATDQVDIRTSDGDIAVNAVTAESASIRTSDGDIRVEALTARGEVSIQTSDGDIRAEAVRSASFTGRTSDGDIMIAELIAESGSLRVSDGSIAVRHVEGALEATGGDADIRLGLFLAAPVTVHTSDGDIDLTVAGDLASSFRLRGEAVRVASSLNFKGNVAEESAEGDVNGGGPLIEARATSGTVSFHTP